MSNCGTWYDGGRIQLREAAVRRGRPVKTGNAWERVNLPRLGDGKAQQRQARQNERRFYILLEREPIGELVLKAIDAERRCCALGICLKNDRFKNHGYGTVAMRQALRYAFEIIGMETVLADSLLPNTRSQRSLQKAGFRFVSEDGHFKYYQISREQFTGSRREEQA